MQQMRQRVQDHDQYMTQQMLDDGGDSALDVSHVLQLGPGSSILYEQGVEIITYGCYKYPDIRSLNKSEVREGCYRHRYSLPSRVYLGNNQLRYAIR